MIKYTELNPEVYRTVEDISVISSAEIEFIRHKALENKRGRARLCMHKNNNDVVHEMLIALIKGTYFSPHKHPGKTESFHVIEGELCIIIFNDQGEPTKQISLSSYNKKSNFFYRMSVPMFHTVIPMTDSVIFHEITNGPFYQDETVFAEWAPSQEAGKQEQMQYLVSLFNSFPYQ